MPFRFNPFTSAFDLVNPTGTGDTIGPASSTDNAVVRFDGVTGKSLQNSLVAIDDSGNISSPGDLSLTGGSGSDLLITQLGKVVLNVTAGGNNYVVASSGGTPSLDLYAGNVKGISIPYAGTQVSLPNGVNLGNITASTALILDSSKNVISSSVTSTELGYVSGVTSALQTQLNNKISSDGSIAFTGNQSIGGHNLTNVATPSSATDAANKQYVLDQVAASGTSAEWQASVITATILDPSTISGSPTVDDRYLINGTGAGGWTGKDNQIAQYVSGSKSLVGSWTYTITTTGTYVSADDALTVLYYFGGSSWTTKSFEVTTASTGLVKVVNDIRTDSSLAGSALTFTTGVLSVNVDNSTLDISSNNLEIKAGGVTNTQVSNSAAIAYSKLNLTSSIVNADVSGSAAIAYSKLNLTGSVINTDIASGAAIAVNKLAALTVNKAVASDSSGFLVASTTTDTELGFVSGVTSAIQTQLNGKQATGNYITAITGDVTATGPGSAAATVAKIQGTTVSGTTGSTNIVFSAAPTLTGLLSGGSASFSSTIAASNFSGSSSGTNTGDVTIGTANGLSLIAQALSLGTSSTSTTGALTSTDWNTFNNKQATISLAAVGSSPNANAATLSGAALNLEPASASFPGVVTTGTQTLAGAKTFSSAVTLGAGLVGTPSINVSDSGTGLYRPASNVLGFTSNGSESGRITASGNWQIGTTAAVSNTAERVSILNSDSAGGSSTYATAATQITLTSTTAYTGAGGVNSAWNRLQRTIASSTTDTGMMGASLNAVRFNVSAAQTLTNSSTDGIYGNIILSTSNQGAGAIASTLYSGFRVQADSTNTGTNKAGLSMGNITGATNNFAILTGTGIVSIGDTTDSSSISTGSVHTSGGLGVTKALWVGTTINQNGASSGTFSQQASASTTNYTVTWPSAQGGSSTVLTNDGSGGLSWASASGANTTLSNLGTTSINADLIPSAINTRNLGSTSIPWSTLNTSGVTWRDSATAAILGQVLGNQTSPSTNTPLIALFSKFNDDASSHDMAIYTASSAVSSANASGTLHLETGNRTAGTGNSGDIALQTGTSSGGTRGTVTINPELRLNGSTSGYVGLKASATPTSHTYVMPTAQGAASSVMSNDGSGNLSWLAATGTGNNVLAASPTLTGTLTASAITASSTITTSGGGNSVILTSAATAANAIAYQTAGSNRWIMGLDGVAESGSDAGSNWQLRARTDAGGTIDNPIVITRATGGAITATRPLVTTSTTDSTSTATGSIKSSGGIGIAKNITTGQMVLIQGYHFRSTTGNFTINDNTNYCIIDAGAQATLTVTMPANPQDGQELKVIFEGAITTLTVSPNSGQTIKNAPVTAATESGFSWFYRSANTTWYRVY